MAPIFAFWGTCKRGAATAVYDYAHFGERLLGVERPVIVCSNSLNGDDANLKLNLKRLRARFGADRVFMMQQYRTNGRNCERCQPQRMRWRRRASEEEIVVIQCGAAGSTREALPERVALRVAGMTERVLLHVGRKDHGSC